MVAFVGQEVLARSQQERTELAFRPVYVREVILLQQAGEKPLRQVAGVLHGVALPTNEGVKRIPVRFAQGRKRFPRLRRLPVAGSDDQAPVRRAKTVELRIGSG